MRITFLATNALIHSSSISLSPRSNALLLTNPSRISHISRNGPTNHPRTGHFGPFHLPLLCSTSATSDIYSSPIYPITADWWEGWGTRDDNAETSLDRGSSGSFWNGGVLYVCYPSSRHTAFELRDGFLRAQFSLHCCTSKSARVWLCSTFCGPLCMFKKLARAISEKAFW